MQNMESITLKGAKENNLKNIDLKIPRNKIVCFIGVSGSGKSTIAFDILAQEGQRQYFESLPSYARRYLQKVNRPNVDEIKGISTTIIISQDRVSTSPRSTVGTLTESYTYLRMLYSRIGLPSLDSSFFSFNHPNGACSECNGLGVTMEIDPRKLINFGKSLNEGALLHSAWQVGGRYWKIIKATNFFDMDKKIEEYNDEDLEKLLYAPKQLWQDESEYGANKWTYQGIVTRLKEKIRYNSEEINFFQQTDCSECRGGRLNSKALSVKIGGKNIGEVSKMALAECLEFVRGITIPQAMIVRPKLEEQLQNLINAGIGYLSLNRSTDTLSGGEAQRVKLARQMGCDLVETIYVLDEPTAGLHPRDVDRVVKNLEKLRDSGNTVLVVEHDEAIIKSSDHIVEIGPGGGKNGGEVVAQGTFKEILNNPKSVSAQYLGSTIRQNKPRVERTPTGFLKVSNARRHNLKGFDLKIPKGVLVSLTGVSGSGKSSLVEEVLTQHKEKIVLVDQSPVGNNRRGCVGTYTGIFDIIRRIFAKEHGMSDSLFSFNSHGACDECKGLGYIDMEMNFLGNVKIHCDTCNGSRYKEKVLKYKYKDKNISEVLAMTASEAGVFFSNKEIKVKTDLLVEVGLDYVELGQSLDTLSGGESQRLKLASRLQDTGEFYILDEPTSGLHFADIERLMRLLNRLVENGNTVLVIEHNLDVIRQSDWIIDLGPEGGDRGGEVIAEGVAAQIMSNKKSYTGQYLNTTKHSY